MKHSLQLKLSQQLTLTPQLQLSIRLLQLSTLELSQEVETFLQDNPLLERIEKNGDEYLPPQDAEISIPQSESPAESPQEKEPTETTSEHEDYNDDHWNDDNTSYGTPRDENDESDSPKLEAETTTLRQHLLWQLNLTQLPDRDRTLVEMLIDALDDAGYMIQDLDELATMLPPELEIEPIELQIALKHLQNFDPIGIGARNLSECLALQLKALPEDTPYRTESLLTVRSHLDSLASRDYNKLKKALHTNDEGIRQIQHLITHLNPRPGGNYSTDETRYVICDVIVKKVKGMWVASLNPDAMPKLRINKMYANILQNTGNASSQQMANQLQEAKWLIKNIQQRFETILRVSQAIVDRQKHFFEHGDVAMRPLVLREIAETVELHESTISRVTTQKYMHTPRGIYELKHFFGSHVTTETGGACSATAIRALIKQLLIRPDEV
ncbi:RNA polymerase factor sigma-54 [Sulfurirhabdus autotrophica]|uniref:RNA polymerase sigma-54 factor n=1 Tax=Sulfurirhabdus autotrophica TaxID=1706046 RepID=A0A4R3XS43_9PROT|nr:RNA polymerase factor sigma-54 [Sulfurirhabdus autotrophica]TCV80087.1 RNA polymerase RpoN-/SigL-like sigma 54 subunit [Sulfurirhabdus autotrophica]